MDSVIDTKTIIAGEGEGGRRGKGEGIYVLYIMENAAHKLCLGLLNYY